MIRQITGLRGKCNIKFGNINIYSPYVKRYINTKNFNCSYDNFVGYFGNSEKECKLNIAISMERPKEYESYCNEGTDIAKKVVEFLEVFFEYRSDMKIEV